MSGDVQPRKRKDKKRKKDELGVEETRGTAAVFGEGDVFIHSQHDHGTGGHWCAKIIFFSLLAVLVTLIGLIILENRGLTDLEANSVESRYSGVLEGWLEDTPEDDHHDEHTLELKHHDDDDDDDHDALDAHDDDDDGEDDHDDVDDDEDGHDDIQDQDNEDEHDDVDDQEDVDEHDSEEEHETEEDEDDEIDREDENNNEDEDDDVDDQNQDLDEVNDEDEDHNYIKYLEHSEEDNDDNDEEKANDDNEEQGDDDNDTNEDDDNDTKEDDDNETNEDDNEEDDDDNQNVENDNDEGSDEENEDEIDQDESNDQNIEAIDNSDEDNDDFDQNDAFDNQKDDSGENNIEDDDNHEEDEQEEGSEVEVERIEREAEEEPISAELPAPSVDGDDDEKDQDKEASEEDETHDADGEEDDLFLEPLVEDVDLPVVEHITAPSGKPFHEVEDEPSSEQPPDTLAEEEEYEKRQEELRREEEQASHKDGGNSIEDEWPGEPSDSYWRQELDQAEEDLRQGAWFAAAERADAAPLRASARARWLRARALDAAAEQQRDNRLLTQAINAYLHLLKMNEHLPDDKLLGITKRTLDRIQFRGNYLSAEPVYRLLIRRFPNNRDYRNNLSISFLMANRADLAGEVLKETLKRWPNDRVALAHYGFVLKTQNNRLDEAVDMLQRALEGDSGPANEPRFYYHLGDTLLLLGRYSEAREVHKRGAALGHFLSPSQRSLYNVLRLKTQPWWNIAETPYLKLARDLEHSWRDILKEGEAARALYEKEREGLKERGEWSQLDLFVRGREIPGRCQRAPVTCSVVRAEVAASGCRRGQIKFSAMEPGTHVRPHVGPTNCRLRIHLGLSNTKDTYIRVDKEIRKWKIGKVFMFDDSFEHEVWHNGTGTRLVLIVDVWHPELTAAERQQLPAI